MALSEDHKPCDGPEKERILRAGGHVAQGMMGMGPMRVDGNLAVSRGLGDFEYKQNAKLPPQEQKVSCLPDITIVSRDMRKDELLVLACDGIWDVMSNDECCNELRTILAEGEKSMGMVAEELLDVCLELGSKDNMSAIVITFPAGKLGDGPGVAGRRAAREAARVREEAAGAGGGGGRSRSGSTPQELARMREVFDKYDADGNGLLDRDEVSAMAKELGNVVLAGRQL